jgi:hypothetical protein
MRPNTALDVVGCWVSHPGACFLRGQSFQKWVEGRDTSGIHRLVARWAAAKSTQPHLLQSVASIQHHGA